MPFPFQTVSSRTLPIPPISPRGTTVLSPQLALRRSRVRLEKREQGGQGADSPRSPCVLGATLPTATLTKRRETQHQTRVRSQAVSSRTLPRELLQGCPRDQPTMTKPRTPQLTCSAHPVDVRRAHAKVASSIRWLHHVTTQHLTRFHRPTRCLWLISRMHQLQGRREGTTVPTPKPAGALHSRETAAGRGRGMPPRSATTVGDHDAEPGP